MKNFQLTFILVFMVLLFSHCTSDDGDNFDEIPPAGFAELNINVRQWTSATTVENRGGAVVKIFSSESDRSSLENETHINNTDTSGNCIFIDVPKSSTIYLHSELLDGAIKEEDLELTDEDIQTHIIVHDI